MDHAHDHHGHGGHMNSNDLDSTESPAGRHDVMAMSHDDHMATSPDQMMMSHVKVG